jgi:hypothetical protein
MKNREFMTERHSKTTGLGTAGRLLSYALIGTSLALPGMLWASPHSLESLPNQAPQQKAAPANAQQPQTQQPAQATNGQADNNRPGRQVQPPRNGGRPPAGSPRPGPGAGPRPPQNGGPGHYQPRPPAFHHPYHGPRRPAYGWGTGNGWRLRHFFLGDSRPVNLWHRHRLYAGGYFPALFLRSMQPVPPSLRYYLSPVPPGYEFGYFDGYCFVYDPDTLMIVSVIDLYKY